MMMMITWVLLSFAIQSCVVSARVLENNVNYLCGMESQNLQSENASRDTDCEQSWVAKSITIGSYISGIVECHHPCINMTVGKIIISDCINVTLTVICFSGHVTEYRINYIVSGIQNNSSPEPIISKKRGQFGIWISGFLLLMIIGATIQHFCLKG